MANHSSHITEYNVLLKVLFALMFFTFLTITISWFDLGAFSVTAALLIACTKGFLVLSNFMHLKYESVLLRVLVAMVFVLFAIIVLITFIDYAFR